MDSAKPPEWAEKAAAEINGLYAMSYIDVHSNAGPWGAKHNDDVAAVITKHAPKEQTPLRTRSNGGEGGRMKAAYIYTYTNHEHPNWRVYEALVLSSSGPEYDLVYVDETNALRHTRCRHLTNRNSAHAFVFSAEFEMLARDIEKDHEKRKCCWTEMDDIHALRISRQFVTQSMRPPTQSPNAPLADLGGGR